MHVHVHEYVYVKRRDWLEWGLAAGTLHIGAKEKRGAPSGFPRTYTYTCTCTCTSVQFVHSLIRCLLIPKDGDQP
ncbi:MAG: hypothetical protein ACREMA_10910, partial [Longimicrobiales bacterium]